MITAIPGFIPPDRDAAISLIETTFATWKGCELHRISYISDEECNADNIAWMNDLRAPDDMQETFTECIAFTSEFHSPKKGGRSLECGHGIHRLEMVAGPLGWRRVEADDLGLLKVVDGC